jgi:hypothetical protein
MDLLTNHGFDDNHFPLNPDWRYFVNHKEPPDANQLCNQFSGVDENTESLSCTGDPVEFDGPGSFLGIFTSLAEIGCPFGRGSPVGSSSEVKEFESFHGHVNWEPATYEGPLKWEGHSKPIWDDEYSMSLRTPNGAGGTVPSSDGIHLEFDSAHTIDQFGESFWWSQLRSKVDQSPIETSGKPAAEAIDGHLAVVTGLIGLDTAHAVKAESHPVYAMAIRTDTRAAETGGIDKWALFARNSGNEGFCSHKDHELPPGPLRVRIPWLNTFTRGRGPAAIQVYSPASHVDVLGNSSEVFYENVEHPGVAAHVIPGQGVVIEFDLSTPASEEPQYFGTVDLKWTPGEPAKLARSSSRGAHESPAASGRSSAATKGGESADVERLMTRLLNGLSRRARLGVEAYVGHRRKQLITKRLRTRAYRVPIETGGPQGPVLTRLLAMNEFVPGRPDHAVLELGKAQRTALCRAYKANKHPGPIIRAACKRKAPKRKAAPRKAR